jgi:hypothetical protein
MNTEKLERMQHRNRKGAEKGEGRDSKHKQTRKRKVLIDEAGKKKSVSE